MPVCPDSVGDCPDTIVCDAGPGIAACPVNEAFLNAEPNDEYHLNQGPQEAEEPPRRDIESITGATDRNGELEFYVQFQDNYVELIPSRVANVLYPDQVISYYEHLMMWENRDGSLSQVSFGKEHHIY